MNKALEESPFDRQVIEHLKARFAETADFMRNRKDLLRPEPRITQIYTDFLLPMLQCLAPTQRMQVLCRVDKLFHGFGVNTGVLPQ